MRLAGHVARMGVGRRVYRVLVGKPEGKRPLGRPRRRWVDNIRIDLRDVGCRYMDWIGLAQDGDRWRTLVSAVISLRVPWNAGNILTSCKPVSFSRRNLHHGVSEYVIVYGLTVAPLGRQEHVAVIVFCGTADSGFGSRWNFFFRSPRPAVAYRLKFFTRELYWFAETSYALPGIQVRHGTGKRLFLKIV